MTEKEIENYFKAEIKKLGGLAIKLNSMSMSGLPDRMALLPNSIIFFAELKRPKGKARPLQLAAHKILRNLGFDVYVIDSKEQVKEVLNRYGNF